MNATVTPVPASILKLEQMRILRISYFAVANALSERRQELSLMKKDVEQRVTELQNDGMNHVQESSAAGVGAIRTSASAIKGHIDSTLQAYKRQLDALAELSKVVDSAIEENRKFSGDARAFEAAKEHNAELLRAWGLDS